MKLFNHPAQNNQARLSNVFPRLSKEISWLNHPAEPARSLEAAKYLVALFNGLPINENLNAFIQVKIVNLILLAFYHADRASVLCDLVNNKQRDDQPT